MYSVCSVCSLCKSSVKLTEYMPDLAEEGCALLCHLCRVLVELQWLCELVHEEVGMIWLLLCKILDLALQKHYVAVPHIQLIPHMLENKEYTYKARMYQ